MKIIFTTHDLAQGGSEYALIHEVNGMTRRGHEVFVFPMLKNQHNELQSELKIKTDHFLPFYFASFLDLKEMVKLIRWLRKNKPDAVVSGSLFSTMIFKVAKIFAPRFNFIVRESNILIRHGFFNKLFNRATQRQIDQFYTNCEAVRKDLICQIYIPGEKISVIRNGIDSVYFNIPKHNRGDVFKLLNVGSMSTIQKGQDYLIQAIKIIKDNFPGINCELILVGNGRRQKILEELVKKLGIGKYVKFLGRRSPPYSEADLLVFPSLWEGMPNAVLEAMAAGLPVIATPVGGIPEVVRDGLSGVIVPPKDAHAIANATWRLFKNPQILIFLAQEAKKIVSSREFTWDDHVDKLEILIENIN
ncbi:MAG: group 1 glycosyl transferase [Parcubacteria group bacterium Licking1014_17]|nr:MAG: group 1 glycosyl transferase [Parcubacteria group bacterium Licking1014_17]